MYKRSGLATNIEPSFINAYRNGSRPVAQVEDTEIAYIKNLMISSLDQIEIDLEKGLFDNYMPWTVGIGVEINTKDDGLGFLPYHEGLHQSVIQQIARRV